MKAHTAAVLACRILAVYFVLRLIASGFFVGMFLSVAFAAHTPIFMVMNALFLTIVTVAAIAALWFLAPMAARFFLVGADRTDENQSTAIQPRDLMTIACMVMGIYFAFMGLSAIPNQLIVLFYFDSSVGNPQLWTQEAANLTVSLAQSFIGAGLLIWAHPIAEYAFPTAVRCE